MPTIDLIIKLEYTSAKSWMFTDAYMPLKEMAWRLDKDLERLDLPTPDMEDIWISNCTPNTLCFSFRTKRYSDRSERVREVKRLCFIAEIRMYEEEVGEADPLGRVYRSPSVPMTAGEERESREQSLASKDEPRPVKATKTFVHSNDLPDSSIPPPSPTKFFVCVQYASDKAQWLFRHEKHTVTILLQDLEFLKLPHPAQDSIRIDEVTSSVNFFWKMKKPSALHDHVSAFFQEQFADGTKIEKKRACKIVTLKMYEERPELEYKTDTHLHRQNLYDRRITQPREEEVNESYHPSISPQSPLTSRRSIEQLEALQNTLLELDRSMKKYNISFEDGPRVFSSEVERTITPTGGPFHIATPHEGPSSVSGEATTKAHGIPIDSPALESLAIRGDDDVDVSSDPPSSRQDQGAVPPLGPSSIAPGTTFPVKSDVQPFAPSTSSGSELSSASAYTTVDHHEVKDGVSYPPLFDVTNRLKQVPSRMSNEARSSTIEQDVGTAPLPDKARLQYLSSLASRGSAETVPHNSVLAEQNLFADAHLVGGTNRPQELSSFTTYTTDAIALSPGPSGEYENAVSGEATSDNQNAELIFELTKSFWSTTRNLNALSARALVLQGMLRDLGVDDMLENGGVDELQYNLAKTRLRLQQEQVECERLSKIVEDVKRECEDPVVVPALVDGFELSVG
ncbi:hypothetical protein VKT23_019480 [Stygiomarasmius scandens]|uniref:Uncharacterized protein n=1 Tax=Marasmiellus scandens TaxID=2682957 RepID=A0ABR1ILB1_9AGAR